MIEDGPRRTFNIPNGKHYSWHEIDKILGHDAWIFSRRDSAIRAFGFLAAWWSGSEEILTLDDDCYPVHGYESLFDAHIKSRSSISRWIPSIPGMRTRGLPYRNLGSLPVTSAHMGLWSNVPDYDAAQALVTPPAYFNPPSGVRVVPQGQLIPVCGMNLSFHRRVLPFFYFPKMGEGSPYSRFDDIWAGIMAKRQLDHIGEQISVGEPFVEHKKASNPFTNLIKEAPGVAANETFWEAVIAADIRSRDAVAMPGDMGRSFAKCPDPYIREVGRALNVWVKLLSRRPKGL